MRTSNRAGTLARAALLLAALVVAGQQAVAGPLKDFTGYTRIGWPPDDWRPDDPKYKEALKSLKAMGVTIYYMVLDRETGEVRGTTGDTWGTGVANFDNLFVAGMNHDRGTLDTNARYLYLYQLVNDSGREAAVRTTSIRLIVPLNEITSWGHFAERRRTDKGVASVKGVGFALPFLDKGEKGDGTIRPVSTERPGVSERRYLSPAPAVTAPRTYRMLPITLGDNVPVAEGDDTGVEPDVVVITEGATTARDAAVPRVADVRAGALTEDRMRARWPAIRAFWNTNPVKPRQRSTVFGFTSNAPPTLEETVVESRALGVGIAKAKVGEGTEGITIAGYDRTERVEARFPGDRSLPDADTRVVGAAGTGRDVVGAVGPGGVGPVGAVGPTAGPTGTLPTPYIRPAADVGGTGGVGGVGGLGALPGGLGGMPFSGGGFGGMPGVGGVGTGAFFPPRSSGGGGFGGGGTGGGEGETDTGTDTQTGTNLTNSVNVNVRQQQQQQQKQNQNQNQNQNNGGDCGCKPHGDVVPLPAAWLLGLLGLPAFLMIGRRKPAGTPEEAKPEETPAA